MKELVGARAALFAAALFPWADILILAALGIGGVACLIAFTKEFGCAGIDRDPARCPSCGRDELLRVEAAVIHARVPLLQCRSCGSAFRWWGGTLHRDVADYQLR